MRVKTEDMEAMEIKHRALKKKYKGQKEEFQKISSNTTMQESEHQTQIKELSEQLQRAHENMKNQTKMLN